MLKIITIDNQRYNVENIKHRNNGIVFYYNDEEVVISNDNIKSIDAFNPVSAKPILKSLNKI